MFIFSRDIMTEQLWGYEKENTLEYWKWPKRLHEELYKIIRPSSSTGFFDSQNSHVPKQPESMNEVSQGLVAISWKINDGDSIPAWFWWNEVVLHQRIDLTLYRSILTKAKEETQRSIKHYELNNETLTSDERCQIAMHMISHEIATQLRPSQDDSKYKAYVDDQVSKWSTILDPEKINTLQLENCVIKSIIAKKFLDTMWFNCTLYSSKLEEHNYVTVSIWNTIRRLDVNSPVPTEVEWYEIFYKANMASEASELQGTNEAVVRQMNNPKVIWFWIAA